MFKFLHLADVHLDTTFQGRSAALRNRLRSALRTAFERAVDTAIEECVHAVLIAGDLFDGAQLSFETERFLLDQLRRLDAHGIECIYATGNHDPGGRRYRGGRLAWPATFHRIADAGPFVHEVVDEAGRPVGRVVAMGHATDREKSNLAANFPVADGDIPHVGMLHTFVTSADQVESHARYAPCSLEDLRRCRYRYWALGHIHKRQQVCDVSEAWYPGNIQGRHPKETGAKGGLLVALDRSGPPDVTFRSLAPLRWEDLEIDGLEEAHTQHDLAIRIDVAFEELARDDAGADDWLLRIRLQGRTPMASMLRDAEERADLEAMLSDRLGVLDVVLRVEHVTPAVDVDIHRGEPHLLGSVLQLIEEAREDPELLRSLAPEHLARSCPTDEEQASYLRVLLDGLDAEAADRLLDLE